MRRVNADIIPSTTIDSTITMASNLAVLTCELTQNIIDSKLQGDQGLTDDQTANIASDSESAVATSSFFATKVIIL